MSDPNNRSKAPTSGRSLLTWFTGAALAGSAAISGLANFIFLKPRATYGQPSRYSIGQPDDYPSGARVSLDQRRVCVVRDGSKLAVISTICTHLDARWESPTPVSPAPATAPAMTRMATWSADRRPNLSPGIR